jgi:HAD superfamily hydrolase (TIGR01509 family)
MLKPEVVVFDLGKVLLDFDYGIAAAKLQKFCRLTVGELQALINQSPLLFRYEINLLNTDQFFAEIQSASGYCGSLQEFRTLFGDIFSPIEPMIDLQEAIRSRGVPTYIFSNTNEMAIEHIRERFPFFRNFDGYVLSYEHNAMKPDAKLYEVVEKTAGKRGSQILYIDDRPENIATGRARGWQTILHENLEWTRKSVLPLLD